jgi:hypothetical protein
VSARPRTDTPVSHAAYLSRRTVAPNSSNVPLTKAVGSRSREISDSAEFRPVSAYSDQTRFRTYWILVVIDQFTRRSLGSASTADLFTEWHCAGCFSAP